jgi:hypothetical protein
LDNLSIKLLAHYGFFCSDFFVKFVCITKVAAKILNLLKCFTALLKIKDYVCWKKTKKWTLNRTSESDLKDVGVRVGLSGFPIFYHTNFLTPLSYNDKYVRRRVVERLKILELDYDNRIN